MPFADQSSLLREWHNHMEKVRDVKSRVASGMPGYARVQGSPSFATMTQPPHMQFLCLAYADLAISKGLTTRGPDFHREFKEQCKTKSKNLRSLTLCKTLPHGCVQVCSTISTIFRRAFRNRHHHTGSCKAPASRMWPPPSIFLFPGIPLENITSNNTPHWQSLQIIL